MYEELNEDMNEENIEDINEDRKEDMNEDIYFFHIFLISNLGNRNRKVHKNTCMSIFLLS